MVFGTCTVNFVIDSVLERYCPNKLSKPLRIKRAIAGCFFHSFTKTTGFMVVFFVEINFFSKNSSMCGGEKDMNNNIVAGWFHSFIVKLWSMSALQQTIYCIIMYCTALGYYGLEIDTLPHAAPLLYVQCTLFFRGVRMKCLFTNQSRSEFFLWTSNTQNHHNPPHKPA